MKNLNQYIQEKYLIDNDTKMICSKKEIDNVVNNVLGPWLFTTDTYKGIKNHLFEFLKYFDNNLIDMMKHFQAPMKLIADELNVDINEVEQIIKDNNEELYKQCKIFYQNIFDEIAF